MKTLMKMAMAFLMCVSLAGCDTNVSSEEDLQAKARRERDEAMKAVADEGKEGGELEQIDEELQKKVGLLTQEATDLMMEPSPEAALKKVEEGLALDTDNERLKELEERLRKTLESRCCGKWSFHKRKGTSSKMDVSGAVQSLGLHQNRRGENDRGNLSIACDSGRVRMSVGTPWGVPQRDAVTIKYVLGDDPQRLDVVSTRVSSREYTFQGPTKWLKKLAKHDGKQLIVEGPKNDGTQGTLKFDLGQVSQVVAPILEACD